jgi:hypothetical protein
MGHEGRISGNAGSLEKMDDVDQKLAAGDESDCY